MSSYLNSINLDHLSYTVCSTSYFGDKINIMHISRDERTPWINLKFAWYCKIFIWLINFILITKTFFCSWSCAVNLYWFLLVLQSQPTEATAWAVMKGSRFCERKKVPSTVWVLSQIMKHTNIKGYMLKCAVYLYSLYVCIKPFVKKNCKIHLPGQRKLSVMLANFCKVGFLQLNVAVSHHVCSFEISSMLS